MRSRALPIVLTIVVLLTIAGGYVYNHKGSSPESAPIGAASATPSSIASATASPSSSPSSPAALSSASPGVSAADLSVDDNGLSKATAVVETTKGVFKFKFYTKDAPNTVNRIVQLIQQGFYNGIIFHRVEPGFVVQTGDPTGTGKGGSGQKLKAEFNNRLHAEGTLAMARTRDPDSADSQFYITFGPQPRLDHQYTVFGQVIDGMDAVRKIQVGDKIVTAKIE
jgi:cyclophilin family peptidyl-prolyl cis-trans isomerase